MIALGEKFVRFNHSRAIFFTSFEKSFFKSNLTSLFSTHLILAAMAVGLQTSLTRARSLA